MRGKFLEVDGDEPGSGAMEVVLGDEDVSNAKRRWRFEHEPQTQGKRRWEHEHFWANHF